MRIAIATVEFVTEETYGGLGTYSANLARMLKKHGHEVTVLVISYEDRRILWEQDIEVYRIRYPIRRFYLWNLLGRSWVVDRKLRQLQHSKNFELIHYCASDALPILRTVRTPSVVRISCYVALWRQACLPDFDYDRAVNALKIDERVQLLSLHRCDAVFAPSRIIAEITARKFRGEIRVIESPFWMDAETGEGTGVKTYPQWLEGRRYLLFYGTLGYLKGVHTICVVLNDFFAQNPEHCFAFVGRTSQMCLNGEWIDAAAYIRASVAEQYQDRLIILNAVSDRQQLYALVRHAEAVVLPSRIDNLPNTCIESMALERIVIGTRGASFEQLLEDGENGFLIEREDCAQLLAKMTRVIHMSEDERAKMGARAAMSIERLSPDRVYEELIGFYQSVVDGFEKRKR